jgi:2',3'-cyclic-nucleotide 2'-phosphodiesterase/3'-nucleotidase
VPILRQRERADLVVIAMHMGFERNLLSGDIWPGQVPDENAALAIAEQVPGIDVILMGHTHRDVPMHVAHGVLFTQSGRWGDRLARADVIMERDAAGAWRVVEKVSRTIPVTVDVAPDPAIVALAEPYDRETQAWLDREIGECAVELTARDGRVRDTAIMDLIHRVQLEAGAADVSMAACFSLTGRVPAGKVTVRDIAGLYVYENTLVVLEATGAEIKAALEHAAKYFQDAQPGLKPGQLIDNRIPGYNFDIAAGVDYVIDLRRPVGDRIVDLEFLGEPIDPDRKFRLAINNYRQNGGGGYTMYPGAPVLQRSSTEIRDLIIAWVEKHHTIPIEPDDNWRIVTE